MDLVIGNKIIITPMDIILECVQRELTNGKLKDVGRQSGKNIPVTCPCHKDGKERHPSCMVFADMDDDEIVYGTVHCFTCGYKSTFPNFINDCFDETGDFGEEWLLERCKTAFVTEVKYLKEIQLDKPPQKTFMNDDVLKQYAYYHDYMWQRKLSKEIVDLFEVGYDKETNSIVFPVRDEKGRLVFITSRSVSTKWFNIPKEVEKPVYLLYYIRKNNIQTVNVVESQINALYSWSLGMPACALFGTGTPYQYELLKKSGIRVFNLFFDGDYAGRKGAQRFMRNMGDDVMINVYQLPEGKDLNDLTFDQIKNLKML